MFIKFPPDLKPYWYAFLDSIPIEIYQLLGLFFLLVTTLVFYVYLFNKNKRLIPLTLLLGYIVIVVFYTVIWRPTGESREYNFMIFWSYMANRKEMTPLYLENIMNILLFLPLGVLSGVVFKRNSLLYCLFFCVTFSIIIEILQLIFKKGFAETDDVIHNTLGCLIGYWIWLLLKKMG